MSMGCDIHFHVEQRQPDGTWQRAEALIPNLYRYDDTDPEMIREDWYHRRNYSLFAMLADVRNYGGIKPIEQPRGLPGDVSSEVRAESDDIDADGHSHSYFTVAELLAVDWDQYGEHSGLVDDVHPELYGGKYAEGGLAEAVEKFANEFHEFPFSWGLHYSQGVSGPSAHRYKRINWTEPYWHSAGAEWFACLLRMTRLAGDDLTSVRAVFWFDN